MSISFQKFRILEQNLSSLETSSNKLVLSPSRINQIACLHSIEYCRNSIGQLYGVDSNNYRHFITATKDLPDNTDSNCAPETITPEAIISASKSASEILEGILHAETLALSKFADRGLVPELIKLKYAFKHLLTDLRSKTEEELENEDFKDDFNRSISQWIFNVRRLLQGHNLDSAERDFLQKTGALTSTLTQTSLNAEQTSSRLNETLQFFDTFSIKLSTENDKYSGLPGEPKLVSPVEIVKQVCARFHQFVLAAKTGKNVLNNDSVANEAALQSLLEGILLLHFERVEREQHVEKFMNKSAFIDFYLPSQNIAIEVKVARNKQAFKKIGEELNDDIPRYLKLPDLKHLICFIYDPEESIQNPAREEESFSQTHNKSEIEVSLIISQPGSARVESLFL